MESFGLFDLLKSLLLFKGNPPVSPSNPAPTSSPVIATEPPSQNVSSPPPPQEIVNNSPPTANAYLDFLNRHDELSKRRKRK